MSLSSPLSELESVKLLLQGECADIWQWLSEVMVKDWWQRHDSLRQGRGPGPGLAIALAAGFDDKV